MDDTKARLIDAAGRMFAEKGFEAASVREICQKADANIAAVNYHFGDKWNLYVAALEHAKCGFDDATQHAAAAQHLPASERLRVMIWGMLQHHLSNDLPEWHQELMQREMVRPTPACAHIVEKFIRPQAENLWSILDELLPPETPNLVRWQTGFSIVGQILFYAMHKPIIRTLTGETQYAALTIDGIADHIFRFTMAGLGRESGNAGVAVNQMTAVPRLGEPE